MKRTKLRAALWLLLERLAKQPAVKRHARKQYSRCRQVLNGNAKMATVTSSSHLVKQSGNTVNLIIPQGHPHENPQNYEELPIGDAFTAVGV
ncbi:hypothetical protein [Paenibacillus agricola]|uniref:Uncharacterized protein n=1 Tax=Paenibacillus agricola TaxID=2716264 RepID=A0ABX0JFN4_9BACL|nr:hypothetical protein [Paenibacillus agricola]NHN33508.1 hypothetical protein [Paenibacillus agricola]